MKKYLVIAIILSVCFSCKKDSITSDKKDLKIVSGRVINWGSKSPIDSAVVHFYYEIDGEDSAVGEIEDSVYSDKNGYYQFPVHTPISSLWIWVTKENYSILEILGAPDWAESIIIKGNELNKNIILEMKAKAFFYSPFKKISEIQKDEDSLIITILPYDNIEGNLYTSSERFNGKGSVRFFDGIDVIGDRFLRYKLQYTSANGWKTKIDSVFIPSLQFYTDTIYY